MTTQQVLTTLRLMKRARSESMHGNSIASVTGCNYGVSKADNSHICDAERTNIKPSKCGSTGKWRDSSIPHSGWVCYNIEDLGKGKSVKCEMCEREMIRYVHIMTHNTYANELRVGCICAGHLEGDIRQAKRQRTDAENKSKRRDRWTDLNWRVNDTNTQFIITKRGKDDLKHTILITKSN